MAITTDPADFITLNEVKETLNKTVPSDDQELQRFLAAAQQMIIDRMGQVSPVTATDTVDTCRDVIVLDHRPIVEVTSVESRDGTIPEGDLLSETPGWYVDGSEGVLRHTDRFPGPVRVTYEAGRDPVPGNIHQAALELAAHLWRNSQHGSGGSRPALGEPDSLGLPGAAYALPIRVKELLGLNSQHGRDYLLVG